MRKNVMLALFALMVLGAFAVLGSSPMIMGEFFKTINPEPLEQMFHSNSVESQTVEFSEIVKTNNPPDLTANVQQNKRIGEVPETVLWSVIFSFPEKLAAGAEKARAEGVSEILFTEYFTRQSVLSNENAEIFKQKAATYNTELSPMTRRMREIQSYKAAARSGGNTLANEEISSLKKELSAIQEARNNAVLKYKEEFRKAIDEQSFLAFEQWLKSVFAAKFSSWKATSKDPKNRSG